MISFYQKKNVFFSIVFIFLIIFLQACVTKNKGAKKDLFFETWKLRAQESRGHSPSAKPKNIKLPRTPRYVGGDRIKSEPKKPLPNQKVTLKMENENVGLVLRTLSRGVGQNIMINSDVKGNMNINVKDVPWNEAFLGALKTRGLTYAWEGSIIRVMTIKDMQLDLKVSETKEKQKAVSLGIKRVEPLLTKVIKIDYADPKDLAGNLKELLTKDKEGKKSRGYVMVNEHTNSLIVQAIRTDLARMISLINELDQPTPQILIEADIVETTRDTARNLGIQWGGSYSTKIGNYRGYAMSGGSASSTSGDVEPTFSGGNSGNGFGVNFPADMASAGSSLSLMFGTLGGNILDMQLSALEDDGKVNVLSRPSITTLDNQTAFTESGTRIPYVTIDDDGDQEVEFEDAVLRLEITPHVINNDYLKMKIVVKKDEVDFSKETQVEGNPIIRKRHTQTTLIVHNQETIVISGLTKSYKASTNSGVPVLKNIPMLGWMFKNDGKADNKEDVLIFITPHILQQRMAGEAPVPVVDTRDVPLDDKRELVAPDK
ncbi:Type IV pilus assembly protein PilQ [Candidatus Magnetomoraceae bacterium gMMP-15]